MQVIKIYYKVNMFVHSCWSIIFSCVEFIEFEFKFI
jgi:hypothetical protein